MDVELPNDFEELIRVFGDRIEQIERTLDEDEDFCNKDIDATYQAASKYLQTFEIKFQEKLNELKVKLDQIREENIKISKQNKQQFDDEIEEINHLFSSGKHQEALEKFQNYENHFQQRTMIIQKLPKLYMNDIDIDRYFSIDKPIVISQINKQNSLDNTKKTKTHVSRNEHDDGIDEQESTNSCFDIRFRRSVSQQTVKTNHLSNKESESPLPTISPRSLPFSTRLQASPSTKSLPTTEHDLSIIALSKRSNSQSSRENINNHVQVRSTPSSPNIIPPLMQLQTSAMKANKGDGLSPIYIAPYQHERNTSVLMICNQNSIILFRTQADRLTRWCSVIFDRSNPTEKDSKWHNLFIKSIGFINKTNIYIFTEREFLIYTPDLSSKYYSRILLNDNNYNSEYNNIHLGFGGTVHDQYIYHIYLNIKYHWILSILEVETINHIYDHDLTENFPHVKRYIDICINNRIISFLVEMDGPQYAVMFCTNNINSKLELKRLIHLSYAENPLTICSVYIHYIQKDIYFVNDPSAKIIHLLTQEKYLQSYSITAHTLCCVEDNNELILTLNDGLYSININEQQNFFSKFH